MFYIKKKTSISYRLYQRKYYLPKVKEIFVDAFMSKHNHDLMKQVLINKN